QVQAPGFVYATSIAVPISVTAGHLLLAVMYWDHTQDPVTLVDTFGFTWTPLPKLEVVRACGGGRGAATELRAMYTRIVATGGGTVRLTQTMSAPPLGVFLVEYDGVDMANPIGPMTTQISPSASMNMFMPALSADAPGVIFAFFGDTMGMGDCTA